MNHRVRLCLGSSAVFLLLAAFAMRPAWAAPRALRAHDLGTFNGFDTIGLALNDRGQIVGTAVLGQENARAFLWDAGAMIDLGPGHAPAINNRGQILFEQFIVNLDDSNRCFLRDGETLIDLGTPEGSQCFASDLNNRGQAVGTIQRSVESFPYHISSAFLWVSGALIDLGSLGGDWSIATAVNDRGQVVGGSSIAPFGGEHAFLWEAGRMTDLGAPLGASRAFAINNRGQVALSSGGHVYLWEAGSLTDLGTLGGPELEPPQTGGGAIPLTYPLDINDRGQILVAVPDVPAGVLRYGVWESGVVTPLPSLGGGRPAAARLNNRGEVVGTDRPGPAAPDHLVVWSPGASKGNNAP